MMMPLFGQLTRSWWSVVSAVMWSPHFGCVFAASAPLSAMTATTAKAKIPASETSVAGAAWRRSSVGIPVLPCPAAQEVARVQAKLHPPAAERKLRFDPWRSWPPGRSPPGHRRQDRGGRRVPLAAPRGRIPYLNATAFTASVILWTIRPASSVPCLPLNPFIAATIPTISSETSRIRPTYSTVPCPRSPSSAATIPRVPSRNCVWMYADSLASMDASRVVSPIVPGTGIRVQTQMCRLTAGSVERGALLLAKAAAGAAGDRPHVTTTNTQPHGRATRIVVVATALVVALAALAGTAEARGGGGFIGVVDPFPTRCGADQKKGDCLSSRDLRRMHRAHLKIVRWGFRWDDVEGTKGPVSLGG